ncbi:MAG TPA: hypothetical protein VNC40_08510 [Gaiellaceae bacterium]|nr:hypothetical protein [Gaiellaceae bacterium]
MSRIPASPRSRRRLITLGIAAGIACTVAAVAVLAPNRGSLSSGPVTGEGPANLAVNAPKGRITAADRRAINATLDRFIPAAMERHDPAAAWTLAGPELKAGSTLAEWRAGSSPVPSYLPRETTFHRWQTIDVGPRYVIFNLLLHPRPATKLPIYVFSGEMIRSGGGRWLVNRLYTIAVMNQTASTTHVVGPADFAPPPASPTPPSKAALSHIWLVPVAGLFALILLVPLVLGAAALLRAWRWRRLVRARGGTELPPLPSSYHAGRDER